jgi:hypothetical protein
MKFLVCVNVIRRRLPQRMESQVTAIGVRKSYVTFYT